MLYLPPRQAQVIDLSSYAKKTDVPAISSAMPSAESKNASAGVATTVPRSDHQHPRLTSATPHTTNGNGKATVMFTRTFDSQPVVMGDLVEAADNGPVTFKVESFLDDKGAAWQAGKPYGGAIIYGYRSRQLPVLNLSGILLIGPLLTALGVLSEFKPYVPAANVGFSCLAIMQSN